LFTDRLRHALAQRDRVPGTLAVLFVDLDHFKGINDRYGHAVGDAALQAIADRARKTVRPGDTVARLSGDEFVILCEGVTEAEVHSIAERLVRSMAEPLEVENQIVSLSGSIGVAFATHTDETLDDLIRRADKAMYQAKRDGRGRAVVTPLLQGG
jgi:diguanylate cyclase (GGDEF)-like protein